jgi:uncharacterized DUF497 family protein/predicted DNA binding CopG/RHH family protein
MAIYMDLWTECTGFNWDEGNVDKNWEKHGVADFECEEVFFNQPLVVRHDPKHSQHEARFYALGRTDSNRLLLVAFTVRRKLIRVVSAREMTRRERRVFMKPMMNKKSLKTLPTFRSEEEERNFWGRKDSADYIDWTKAKRVVLPNLTPSVRTISLRLPVTIIARLKQLANKRDMPYQSLLKMFLAERLDEEVAEQGRR